MAEKLKRDYDIIALKTEIGDWSERRKGGDEVRFTLQFHVDGALQDGPQWYAPIATIVSTERLGRRNTRDSELALRLPEDLLDGLRNWFQQETRGDRPLWIHLVKPYGQLRLVPWERLLGNALNVPILMLPDFIFPPPREAMTVLDVVLCGSAPLGHEESSVINAVQQAVDRILSAVARRVRIHVFVDNEIASQLSAYWKSQDWNNKGLPDKKVTLYNNNAAAPYVAEDLGSRQLYQSGTLRSPWLLWMRNALAGRGVDVVHFVCHGYLSRERGAMLFAQSPLERTHRYLAGPVGAVELQTFLTQVGAWSTVFTSLMDNYSEPGLRALADEIAQTRPGPMMMHMLREDASAAALAEGYRFLYSPEPHEPPRSTALFIYCQPYLTSDVMEWQRGVAAPGASRVPLEIFTRNTLQHRTAIRSLARSPLSNFIEGKEDVSAWVASTERFAEQVQLRYQQLARDEILPKGSSREREALDTLDKLREAVAEQESTSDKTGGTPSKKGRMLGSEGAM
jgi:hypothetical protein